MEYVYEFLYCGCIYESSYATMSVHKTIRGAYNAMKAHRLKTFNEWRKEPNEFRRDNLDTVHQDWFIKKTKIEE